MLLKAAVVIQLIPFVYLFLALVKTYGVSMASRAAGVVGLLTTVVGLGAAFLPTSDVSNVWVFEIKLVTGVVGPTALGLFLYWRARESSPAPAEQIA